MRWGALGLELLMLLCTFLILTTTSFFSSVEYTTTRAFDTSLPPLWGCTSFKFTCCAPAWCFGAFCCQNGVLKVWQTQQQQRSSAILTDWCSCRATSIIMICCGLRFGSARFLNNKELAKSRELFGQIVCHPWECYDYYDRGCYFGQHTCNNFQ